MPLPEREALGGLQHLLPQAVPKDAIPGPQSIQSRRRIPVPAKGRHRRMTCQNIWHSTAIPIEEAMNVKPVAADIGSDNAAM